MSALRSVKLSSGHTLTVWDAMSVAPTGQSQLRYEFTTPEDGNAFVLFEGADYGVSPMHAVDSDAALLGLLGFLTLRPGDTDSEYFDAYTEEQRAWCESSACESLQCEVSIAEEVCKDDACACDLWENLPTDGYTWECEDASNVADFQVLDHGEDGSQYFPGCGTAHTNFAHVATGVGDTGTEALDDALDSMAQADHRPSAIQVHTMRESLSEPDKSAFASLDHSECNDDHDGDDWNHYVSIRYNVKAEV